MGVFEGNSKSINDSKVCLHLFPFSSSPHYSPPSHSYSKVQNQLFKKKKTVTESIAPSRRLARGRYRTHAIYTDPPRPCWLIASSSLAE